MNSDKFVQRFEKVQSKIKTSINFIFQIDILIPNMS